MIHGRWSSAAAIPSMTEQNSIGIGIAVVIAVSLGAALSVNPLLVVAMALVISYAAISWSMPRLAVVLGLGLMALPYAWSPDVSVITLTPALVVSAVWIGVSLVQGSRPFCWHSIDLAVAAYVVAPAISALIVGQPLGLFLYTVVNVATPYLALRLYVSRSDLRTAEFLPPTLIGIGCAVSVLAIIEVVLGYNPTVEVLTNPSLSQWTQEATRAGFVRAQASFGHPIALGTFLLIPVGFAAAWPGKRRWWTLAILLPAVLLTFSRGPWIGLIVTFALVIGTERAIRGRFLQVLSLVLIAGLAAWFIGPVQEVIRQTFAPGTIEAGNAAYRSQLIEATFRHMTLAGTPVSQSQTTYLIPGFEDVTSNLALTALRTGVLGLFAWIAIAGLAVRSLIRALRKRDRELRAMSIVVITQFVVLAAVSLITNYQYFFWFSVALLATYEAGSRANGAGSKVDVEAEKSHVAA